RCGRRARQQPTPRAQRRRGYGPNEMREFCGMPKAWFRCGSSSTSQSRPMISRSVCEWSRTTTSIARSTKVKNASLLCSKAAWTAGERMRSPQPCHRRLVGDIVHRWRVLPEKVLRRPDRSFDDAVGAHGGKTHARRQRSNVVQWLYEWGPYPRVGAPAGVEASGLLFDALNLDVDALADLTAITGPGSEQFARLFRRLRFDTPLLDTRDLHGGVVSLENGLQLESGNSHGLLRPNHLRRASLTSLTGENKS